MTDKELLLKAICGYLPYALQVRNPRLGGPDYATGIDTETGKLQVLYNGYTDDIEKFKPYLRPLSSMTKDEVEEFKSISNFKCYPKHIRGAFFDNDYTPFSTFDSASKFCRITTSNVISCIDWLLKNHFDFRGLIEKGLALPAPDGMYETE